MATHPSILAWEIPWTEEPGGLQSKGSQESVTAEGLNNNPNCFSMVQEGACCYDCINCFLYEQCCNKFREVEQGSTEDIRAVAPKL